MLFKVKKKKEKKEKVMSCGNLKLKDVKEII
jgi:hypothetical protein